MEDKDAAMLVAERIGLQAAADDLDEGFAWARPAAPLVRDAASALLGMERDRVSQTGALHVVRHAELAVTEIAARGASRTAALERTLSLLASVGRRLASD